MAARGGGPQGSGDKREEGEERVNPFLNIEKSAVFQSARAFSDPNISARKCLPILTNILYLIHQGEKIGQNEAIECFFAMTKLFQSNDVGLRRVLYIVIKDLPVPQEYRIIVNASLTKDINNKTDVYKANAIRVMCSIIDASMLGQTERYLKQAIVDKNSFVASAALVSAIHLMKTSAETVKRWISEVQEALNSKSTSVQYHALGLLYKLRATDRLAVSRLVSTLTKSGNLRSPLGQCLLIRMCARVLSEEATVDRNLMDYIEVSLRHKSEMVVYEAARAICGLPFATSRELTPAITVLQLFLSSPKATLRYAAVRTLSQVAMSHPLAVTTCNIDLENLIQDSNRSIATLAITTLLKTGSENSVDRLMKQISEFMGEIPDEFKVVVVDAIRSLCLKYPQKHRVLMNFLATVLRDEGGFEYKKVIVETIIGLINSIYDARAPGLDHLCEFIEDCEFSYLSVRILHFLGQEAPKSPTPSKYIRYIFNRVILENAPVRAAAVSALTQIACAVPTLIDQVAVLLTRCLYDADDEVRDRVTLGLAILESPEPANLELLEEAPLNLEAFTKQLLEYTAAGSATPFSMSSVPPEAVVPKASAADAGKAGPGAAASPATSTASVSGPSGGAAPKESNPLAKTPFAALGRPIKSSRPIMVTEEETEYVVSCTKHVLPKHVLFQFSITNTLNDQCLENVTVQMTPIEEGEGLEESQVVPCETCPFSVAGTAWVVMTRDADSFPSASWSTTLKFTVKDVDPSTGQPDEQGYADEYNMDELELATADYMQRVFVPNFTEAWEKLGAPNEVSEIYTLQSMKTIKDAVVAVVDLLGMQVSDRTDDVKDGATAHTLLLAGMFGGTMQVLCRTRMKIDQSKAVSMEVTVRSTDAGVSDAIAHAIS